MLKLEAIEDEVFGTKFINNRNLHTAMTTHSKSTVAPSLSQAMRGACFWWSKPLAPQCKKTSSPTTTVWSLGVMTNFGARPWLVSGQKKMRSGWHSSLSRTFRDSTGALKPSHYHILRAPWNSCPLMFYGRLETVAHSCFTGALKQSHTHV